MKGFITLYVPLKQEIVLKYLKIKYERVEPCSFTFSGRQFKVTASIYCVHQVVLQNDPYRQALYSCLNIEQCVLV